MHPFYEYILDSAGLGTLVFKHKTRTDPSSTTSGSTPQKSMQSPQHTPQPSAPSPSTSQSSAFPHVKTPPVKTAPVKTEIPPELNTVRTQVLSCTKCALHQGKTHYVFGEGNPQADIMFIGEGPGRDEDTSGRPFVGRAGQLLTKIISAMHLTREDVYIANVVKCRPPNNRAPLPDEAGACMPYLLKQIELIKPKVIVLLGATAAAHILGDKIAGEKIAISKIRGSWVESKLLTNTAYKIMPTFHPAALLRNPLLKKDVWEDMKMVMAHIGLKS